MELSGLLRRAARLHPRHEAVRDDEGSLSYAELGRRVEALARGLAAEGLVAGARVVILGRNRRAFVALSFALFERGLVAVPVNWRLRPEEVAFVVRDAGAVAVFADAACAPLVEGLDVARFALDAPPPGWRSHEELLSAGGRDAPREPVPGDAVAVQMYTSGTTGRPKGSMLSHANVSAMTSAWQAEVRLDPADRFLQVTPLFHVGALLMMTSCVLAGATLRLCGEFEPRAVLAVLRAEAITHALFVPTMVRWLVEDESAAGGGFEALRLLVYGAAPMPVPLLERALDTFGCAFLQGYGLTETAGVLTVLRPADHRLGAEGASVERLASVGRAIACAEVAVVDEHGHDVAPGEVGEVIARGDNVHLGYWRHEAEEPRRPGWFHTGDLARIDDEGYVTLVDRVKDMVCVAGENVYPREVERVLARHPAVADCAVIGVPHGHWGEEVLALVVRRAGQGVGERELVQHCRASLARFKCPTRIAWTDELPRNAAGKLLKKVLREPFWQGRERKV